MAEVGELTWIAEIKEIAESKREAESMSEGLEGLADQARQTDAAMEDIDESAGSLGDRFGGLGRRSGLLSGALGLVGSGLMLLVGQFTGATGAITTFTSALKGAYAWLAAGGLSGILSTVSGYISGFVSWLAAGSAGAIAFAAALGAAVGLFVVWVMHITGILDWIENLGAALGSQLPAWARDGLIAVIGIFAGGLAVLGAMIVGFMENGLKGAINRGEEVLGIFEGAWDRTLSRIWSLLTGWKAKVVSFLGSLGQDLASTVSGAVTTAWNAAIPSQVTIPSVTIGGQTIGADIPHVGTVSTQVPQVTLGGDQLNFPQMASGGMIKSGGGAVLHEGEMVLPADVSRDVISAIRRASKGGSGGGETTSVNIEQQVIEIGDQRLDVSELGRTQMEMLADLIAQKQGDQLSTLIG